MSSATTLGDGEDPAAGFSTGTSNERSTAGAGVFVQPGADPRGRGTYAQILRSSAIIGGSSAVNLAIGMVRTKAMAMMLGPAGFGLMGTLTAIADMARTVAELGINNSGVRQIAESAGSGDLQRIARTVTALRRTVIVLGILGALLLVAFSRQVAVVTFGDEAHTASVALLSLAVFLRLVGDGQGALLQGMRRLGDIARVAALGALLGAVVSVALVYWLREDGVAPSLVAVAAMSLAVSWWYSRKVQIVRPVFSTAKLRDEVAALLRLGLAFMTSALLTMGAAYVVRIILIREHGLEAAGLYQAAWAVGGLYVTFILQAMGTDFYPRLVAAANDDAQCNRLVNEQAQVSLLLAGGGVLATLTFAPWAISLLYSGDFHGATEVLRWICLGMALRVVTWPLGYILVAKGKQMLFVGADLVWTVVNVGLTWFCVQRFGLAGAGLAFLGSYLVHLVVIYPICRKLTGFRWSTANLGIAGAFGAATIAVQASFHLFSTSAAMMVGVISTILAGVCSFGLLRQLVSTERIPRRLAWIVRRGPTP